MKIRIKIETDGEWNVGYSPDLSSCYVQAKRVGDIQILMKEALEIYRNDYRNRMEPFTPEQESPKFNHRIKLKSISSTELSEILKKQAYNPEFFTNKFILFRNKKFPFDRILIPNSSEISTLIVKKLFGAHNVVVTIPKKDDSQKYSNINDQA